MRTLLAAIFLLLGPAAATPAQPIPAPVDIADVRALDAVTKDLCDKQVALLGEAQHGDGHTEAFKAALVERLVTRCHFNAVFFEASAYEFFGFNRDLREGKPVTADRIGAAIGGLWKFDREFQPLIPFLFEAAKAHRVTLGGIDGQLSGFEQPYANDTMPAELAAHLAPPRAAECRETFRRRIYSDYPAGMAYDATARADILRCVEDMTRAVDAAPDTPTRAERREMLRNIAVFTEADALLGRTDPSGQPTGFIAARDHAMYRNFRWLAGRLPPAAKIIVWSATAHIAKDATADPAFANLRNFGSYLHADYGARACAVGVSAQSGAYRYSRRNDRPLDTPPPGSPEAIASTSNGTAYLGPAQLAKIGNAPGAAFGHAYHPANWNRALDGLIVFGTEYPPHSTRPGYF
jgi:erythromycin esterase-like protein